MTISVLQNASVINSISDRLKQCSIGVILSLASNAISVVINQSEFDACAEQRYIVLSNINFLLSIF